MFFKYAYRLTAYQSVMRARIEAMAAEREAAAPAASTTAPVQLGGQGRGERTVVPATRGAISGDPVLGRMISFG